MSEAPAHVSSAHAPPPDEPKSPLWLPALGAVLFLGVGLWWAVTPAAPDPVAMADAPTASAASAAPAPAPPPSPATPPQMRPAAPMPSGSAGGLRMGPHGPIGPGGSPSADPAAIQRLLDQMKNKHGR